MIINMSWNRKDLVKIRRKILRETPKGWEPRGPVVALKNAKPGEYVPICFQIIPKQSGEGAGARPDLKHPSPEASGDAP